MFVSQTMRIRQSMFYRLKMHRRKLPFQEFICSTIGANQYLPTKHVLEFGTDCRRKSCLEVKWTSATCSHVRHAHDNFYKDLKMPYTSWGRWQWFFMWRHFGNNFNKADFFSGVIVSFLFVSDSIDQDKTSRLDGLLTDEAMDDVEDLLLYLNHSSNDSKNTFSIGEKDIVYLNIESAKLHSLFEYENSRKAQVLTLGVRITYIKDFHKMIAERYAIPEDLTMQHIVGNAKQITEKLVKESSIARFEFQRVYDQDLKNTLSDWKVSGIFYKIPLLENM